MWINILQLINIQPLIGEKKVIFYIEDIMIASDFIDDTNIKSIRHIGIIWI